LANRRPGTHWDSPLTLRMPSDTAYRHWIVSVRNWATGKWVATVYLSEGVITTVLLPTGFYRIAIRQRKAGGFLRWRCPVAYFAACWVRYARFAWATRCRSARPVQRAPTLPALHGSLGPKRLVCAHLGRSAKQPCFSRAVVHGCSGNCLGWVDFGLSGFGRGCADITPSHKPKPERPPWHIHQRPGRQAVVPDCDIEQHPAFRLPYQRGALRRVVIGCTHQLRVLRQCCWEV
jgi:hypothetical protein